MIRVFFSKLSGKRRKIINTKNRNFYEDVAGIVMKDSKADKPNEVVIVIVDTNKIWNIGYWYKNPGQKAVFVSQPTGQPRSKGPMNEIYQNYQTTDKRDSSLF